MSSNPKMSLELEKKLYLQGIELFNGHEFFEAHEVWEAVWMETFGPEIKF